MKYPTYAALLAIAAAASLAVGSAASAQQSSPNPAGPRIEHPSVAAALEALRGQSGVDFFLQGGWTIANDRANHTLWSFVPADHPAYPAVVRRTVVPRDGQVFIEMGVLCQAQKPACDRLTGEFQAENEKIRESIRRNAR